MKIEMKYKGRRYSSAPSMMRDMQRDMVKNAEREVERQARLSGMRVKRTQKGIQIEGSEAQMKRFNRRIGK